MDSYKHYIRIQRIGSEDIVIHRYSTGFLKDVGGNEEILPGDICVSEDGSRQYNEPWINSDGQYLYKWDGSEQVERPQSELDAELAARPPQPISQSDYDRQRLDDVTLAIADLYAKGVL